MGSNSIKTGTSAITRNVAQYADKVNLENQKFSNNFFTATVTDVLFLESQRTKFFGEFSQNSTFPLGTVKFQKTFTNSPFESATLYAIPYSIHNTVYPRIGEMVKISYDNTYDAQTSKGSIIRIYYYTEVISAWSSVEHNIVPKENISVSLSKNPSITNYKNTEIGIPRSDNLYTPPVIKEKGDIKSIIPLSDNILQGRSGNSIRLGTSDDSIKEIPWKGSFGNPVLILRNGQNTSKESIVFEDINTDGSSIYFLSGQTVNISVSCLNFESYDASIKNQSAIVEPKKEIPNSQVSNNQSITQSVDDTKPAAYVINSASVASSPIEEEIEKLPSSDDEVEFIIDNEVSVTLGIISDLGVVRPVNSIYISGATGGSNNNNGEIVEYNKKGGAGFNLNKIGNISKTINLTPSAKAFLDIIAFAEGTMNGGDFNGYDIYFGINQKIKDYKSDNDAPTHPGIEIFAFTDNTKSPPKKVYSTAAGRYQFIKDTWIKVNGGNIPLTKDNQDLAGYKRMLWNVSADKIERAANDYNTFVEVIGGRSDKLEKSKCIAGIWASLPCAYKEGDNYGLTGCYNQNKSNQKPFDLLWGYYQQALQKYKGNSKTAILAIGTNDVGTNLDTYNNVKNIIQSIKNKNYSEIIVVPPTSKQEFNKVHQDVVKAAQFYNTKIEYATYLDGPESPRKTGYHLINGADINKKYPNSTVFGDSNSLRISNKANGKVGINTKDFLEYIKKV